MDPKVFFKLSYGLYVVASTTEGKYNGQIANTAFQISSDPATIAVSINKNNLTHTYIQASKVFSVSILPQTTPLDFIGRFGFKSGRDTDKFQGIAYKQSKIGAPVLLENSLGYLAAEVVGSIDVETHTVFIGRVVDSEVLAEGEPMTYAYYFQIKRGATPPAAPVPVNDQKAPADGDKKDPAAGDKKGSDPKMQKYECGVCGYVYDPAIGDPDSGIAPGTAFADIPDDWVCPICGVGKSEFEPVE